MYDRKTDAYVIGATAYQAAKVNGTPIIIVAAATGIGDGWAFAWALDSREICEFQSDDSPMNESRAVIYTTDIGTYRIIVAAHDEMDAVEMEDRLRNEIRERVSNG